MLPPVDRDMLPQPSGSKNRQTSFRGESRLHRVPQVSKLRLHTFLVLSCSSRRPFLRVRQRLLKTVNRTANRLTSATCLRDRLSCVWITCPLGNKA